MLGKAVGRCYVGYGRMDQGGIDVRVCTILVSLQSCYIRASLLLIVLRYYGSLRLHPNYERFVAELKTAWPPKREQTQVNASPPVHRAVNFLESVKTAIAAQAATGDEADYPMADAILSTVDDALETLVDHAIGEVGYAARRVYKAIFDSKDTTNFTLPELSFTALCDIVRSFCTKRSLPNDDFSHRIIVVRPRSAQGPDNDDWQVDFVSDRVGYEVMTRIKIQEQEDIKAGYNSFASFPESSGFAGWIFELYAHRFLSGEFNGVLPGRILMATDGCDPPCFTFHPLRHPSVQATGAPLRRNRVIVDLSHSLEGVVLPDSRYYQPQARNNPLFDSFTIKCDKEQKSAVITLFQITKSANHGGSKDGYPIIRKIMKHVRAFFEVKVKVKVKVEYVLVCPSPVETRTWQMPVGWNTSTIVQDHRGEAYCLHLSV